MDPLVGDHMRAVAYIEIITRQSRTAPEGSTEPDGLTQMSWTNFDGFAKLADVVVWRRLDQGIITEGGEFSVNLQARQFRDLRLPLHSAAVNLRLTLDPADRVWVHVGNPDRPDGWVYGAVIRGVLPATT